MDSAGLIQARIDAIKALRKIQKDVDPASGLSVCVRRGVLSDAAEDHDGRARREWVNVELCDHMDGILELVIDAQTKSLQHWLRSAVSDRARLDTAIEAARAFLAEAKP